MAHAKKSSKSSTRRSDGNNSWGGWFVKCELSKEHKAHLKTLTIDFDRLAEWEEQQVRSGYKISVSFNSEKQTFVASLSCVDASNPSYKGTLTAFAPTYWLAKIALFWQQSELLDNTWEREVEPDDGW